MCFKTQFKIELDTQLQINTQDLSKDSINVLYWDKGKRETHSFKLRSVNKADVIKTWSEYTFNVFAFISTNRHAMHRELSDNYILGGTNFGWGLR